MRKSILIFCSVLLFFTVAAPFMIPGNADAATLEEALAKAAKGTEKGQINTEAPEGYLGIPGGPDLNPIIGLLWAIWVGWIFSTVGALRPSHWERISRTTVSAITMTPKTTRLKIPGCQGDRSPDAGMGCIYTPEI